MKPRFISLFRRSSPLCIGSLRLSEADPRRRGELCAYNHRDSHPPTSLAVSSHIPAHDGPLQLFRELAAPLLSRAATSHIPAHGALHSVFFPADRQDGCIPLPYTLSERRQSSRSRAQATKWPTNTAACYALPMPHSTDHFLRARCRCAWHIFSGKTSTYRTRRLQLRSSRHTRTSRRRQLEQPNLKGDLRVSQHHQQATGSLRSQQERVQLQRGFSLIINQEDFGHLDYCTSIFTSNC